MEDNKLIDLHKVAGLFREIQEEEYAKNEAKEESEFKKTVKEVEETDNDSAVEEAEETTKEVTEEAVEETKELAGIKEADRSDVTHAQLLPHIKNVRAAIIKHTDYDPEDYPDEGEVFVNHLDDMMDAGDVDVVDMMQPDYMDTQDRDSLIYYFQVSISKDPALFNVLFPDENIAEYSSDYSKMFESNKKGLRGAEEEVTEQPEMVSMDTTTLSTLLNLAGLKPVTDADINQPQDGAEPVDEYSNSPDEQYADADTQLNKLSGGINRPKAMPTVGNDGHNRIVMKLKKSYDDME